MWNLKSIEAVDFLSHEKTEIEVKGKETTLVYGKNVTDRGVDSNGSGKSSILEMVYFCMTGNSLRKVKVKELIRNGQKEGKVVIILENPVIPMILKIIREVHSKKATSVRLYENDVLREDLMDLKPSETNKVILEHLEISAKDLENYYLISKEKYSSLLLSSDTQKKEVINRFSKADYIDIVFPQIDLDIAEQQVKVDDFVKVKEISVSQVELLDSQIEELKEKDIDVEKTNKIEVIQNNIRNKHESIDELIIKECKSVEKIDQKEKDRVELNERKDKIPLLENIYKDIDALEKEINDKTKIFNEDIKKEIRENIIEVESVEKETSIELSECKSTLRDSEKTLSDLVKISMGEIECPNCEHLFIVNSKEMTLEECKEKMGVEKEVIEILNEDISEKEIVLKDSEVLRTELEHDLDGERKKFNESLRDIRDKITIKREEEKSVGIDSRKISNLIKECDDDIINQQRISCRSNDKISEFEKDVKDYKVKIKEIKDEPNPTKDQIKVLNDKIREIQRSSIENDKGLEKEQVELDELKEWKVNFKRFKSFLANQSLALIEQQANHFLDKMRSDNRVCIDGFRELSNGKMKEEISIEVSRDSLTTESFGKFSGGEKAKVDLSCILAMQTLINKSCKNGGLDFLFCDEILESADSEAMNSIATSLTGVDKTVFMIAQSQPNVDCNMLEVKKENKISNIIRNDS